jgi:hypothetical protein
MKTVFVFCTEGTEFGFLNEYFVSKIAVESIIQHISE